MYGQSLEIVNVQTENKYIWRVDVRIPEHPNVLLGRGIGYNTIALREGDVKAGPLSISPETFSPTSSNGNNFFLGLQPAPVVIWMRQ